MADSNLVGGTPGGYFVAPLTHAASPIMLPLYNESDGGGDGHGQGGKPGAGDGQDLGQGAPGAPADKGVAPRQGHEPGSGQGEKVYTFKEDRSDWVPRTRLNEVSGKLTKFEKENLTLKQQNELLEKRTRALVGVETPDPEEAKAEEIREALYKIAPQLKALEGLTVEQLQEVMAAAQTARSSSQASWERHARSMLDELETEATQRAGVEKLSPRQQKSLQRAYREEASAALAAREAAIRRGERESLETEPNDTDFIARHERGDKTLIKEFVKEFLSDWYEPARRSVAATQIRRGMRPVPRGDRTRTPAVKGQDKVDLTNNADFKKALIAARGSGQE